MPCAWCSTTCIPRASTAGNISPISAATASAGGRAISMSWPARASAAIGRDGWSGLALGHLTSGLGDVARSHGVAQRGRYETAALVVERRGAVLLVARTIHLDRDVGADAAGP